MQEGRKKTEKREPFGILRRVVSKMLIDVAEVLTAPHHQGNS